MPLPAIFAVNATPSLVVRLTALLLSGAEIVVAALAAKAGLNSSERRSGAVQIFILNIFVNGMFGMLMIHPVDVSENAMVFAMWSLLLRKYASAKPEVSNGSSLVKTQRQASFDVLKLPASQLQVGIAPALDWPWRFTKNPCVII